MTNLESSLFCPQTSFGKPRQFLQKYLLLAIYNFLLQSQSAGNTVTSPERKSVSQALVLFNGHSLYVNMKYENKPGKEERATFLKDQITIKKEKSSKGRKFRLLVIATQWNRSRDAKIQAVASHGHRGHFTLSWCSHLFTASNVFIFLITFSDIFQVFISDQK